MLELKDITISLADKFLVKNFSLKIAAGEIVTITGASGSGKSSLLNYIIGALSAPFTASGEVILAQRPLNGLPIHQREIGILLQRASLFPHLSVADNLRFALPKDMDKQEKKHAIAQALRDCEMEDFALSDPASLSGGQKARIALMRSLLACPKCLLLDEPFSALDPELRQSFRQFVFAHIRQMALPAILVTHDEWDAKATQGKQFTLPLTAMQNTSNS